MSPWALWTQRTAFLALLPADITPFSPLHFDKNSTAKGIEEKCNDLFVQFKRRKTEPIYNINH